MKVPKDKLNELIADAGLGSRTAKKLHEANGSESEAAGKRRTRGHGASHDDRQHVSVF